MRFTRRNQAQKLAETLKHGRALIRERKDQEALQFLEKAARDFPEAAEIPLMLATVCGDSRPDAIPAFLSKAAELGFDDPVIQVMVGHRLLNEEDVEAARHCAGRAEHLIDDNFALMADMDRLVGRIAARDGDDGVAEARLRSAFQREQGLPTHTIDLARFLWARRRNEDALAVIDKSIERVRDDDDKDLLKHLRREIASDR